MDPQLFQRVIAFEEGRLTEDETITLFQELINTGDAWKLPGRFGRIAWDLLQAGTCERPPRAQTNLSGRPILSRDDVKSPRTNKSSDLEPTNEETTS